MKSNTLMEALAHLETCPKATKILFGSIFSTQTVKKGEHMPQVLEDESHNHSLANQRQIHFLESGLLHLHFRRNYYDQANTRYYRKNTTVRFFFPKQFFSLPIDVKSPLESLIPIPAPQLTALRDSILHTTNYQKALDAYHKDPHIAQLVLALQDQWNKELLEEIEMHHRPAIQRYQQFIQKTGANQLYIPQQLIASYLLITTKHLSRLKSKSLLQKTPTA